MDGELYDYMRNYLDEAIADTKADIKLYEGRLDAIEDTLQTLETRNKESVNEQATFCSLTVVCKTDEEITRATEVLGRALAGLAMEDLTGQLMVAKGDLEDD